MPVTDAAPHPLAARFAQFVAFLLEGIAECGGRSLIAGPLTLRLQRRFNKMVRRFAALVAHLAAFGVDAPVRAWHRKQPPPAATPQDAPQVPAPAPAQIPPRDPDPFDNPLPKWARPAAARPPAFSLPPLRRARTPARPGGARLPIWPAHGGGVVCDPCQQAAWIMAWACS